MTPDFWQQAWEEGRINFHQDRVHPDLLAHAERFLPGQRVLVPLCGKSHDLVWLAARGLSVVGVELSPLAVAQFHEEHGISATITAEGGLQRWDSPRLTIYVADIFTLSPAQVGRFERIWDRAALVALAPPQRPPYARLLTALLADQGAMLLNCFRYDLIREGPPHSVPEHEVLALYGAVGALELRTAVADNTAMPQWREQGLRELVTTTWWLSRQTQGRTSG